MIIIWWDNVWLFRADCFLPDSFCFFMKLRNWLRLPRTASLEDRKPLRVMVWIGLRSSLLFAISWTHHFILGFYLADILVLCRFRSEDNDSIQSFPTDAEKRKLFISQLDLFYALLLCYMRKSYIWLYRQEMGEVNGRIVYICNTRLQIPRSKRADYKEIDDSEGN